MEVIPNKSSYLFTLLGQLSLPSFRGWLMGTGAYSGSSTMRVAPTGGITGG